MKSERLKRIESENKKYELETPFNFCDRWCERCESEKQARCKLYQDELEQRLICIAHGKDEHDPEITEQVMRQQFADMQKQIQDAIEDMEVDFDLGDDFSSEEASVFFQSLKDKSLVATADEYCKRAHEFLKPNFYQKNEKELDVRHVLDLETISWYHFMLPVKLERAVRGMEDSDEEFSLHDAVAQFAICRKAIMLSAGALRNIQPNYAEQKKEVIQLLALLNNILHRIVVLEESV